MTRDLPADAAVQWRRRAWLHPASAWLIMAVDWLFFGAELGTLELGLVATSCGAFAIAFVGVFWIQRVKNRDSIFAAVSKSLFAGLVAGIPTSIAGTLLGTLVLYLGRRHGKSGSRVRSSRD